MVTHPQGAPSVHNRSPGGRADGFSDIKKMVRLVWKHWYLFAISIPFFLGAVYLYHRYTQPVYRGSVTMLLKNEPDRVLNDVNLMEGFGLSPEVRNLENQSFIIRSQKTIREAIERLDFHISYFADGRFKDTEIYDSAPFKVVMDENHPQILETPINIRYLENGRIRVSASAESGVLHRFDQSENVKRVRPFSFEKEVEPGDKVEHAHFSFRIVPNEETLSQGHGDYFIKFHSHDQLTGRYRSRVSVDNYREESSIVFINSTGHNPRKIERFLDVLSDVIIENNLERKNDMASRSLKFIQEQLKSVEDTLSQTQQKLMDFRKRNRFMVPSEFASRLSGDFFEKEKELRLLDLKYDYFSKLKNRLRSGEMSEDYLLSAYSDEDAGMVNQLVGQYMDVFSEIKVLEKDAGTSNPYYEELQQRLNVTSDMLVQAIEKRMETLKIREEEINGHITELSGRMEELPELDKEYLELERAYDLNDAIYTFLLQKNSETQIAKASNVPDNEILDKASVSGVVSPDKRGNYGKAFLLALLLPAAIIGLREMLNSRVRDRDEMELLAGDFPNMGNIVRNKMQTENVIQQTPNSLMAESFRSLRTKIRFMSTGEDQQTILVTSTNTGEGKTFCALNLASVFAITGKKVALLGFDMRKPRLSDIFDKKQQMGLSNYLIGQCDAGDIIYSTDIDNLSIVPSGVTPPNPSELINGEKTKELFDLLRTRFDVIVVDTPPIGLVADARMLMQYCDCHLFVVRAGLTRKEHFAATMEELRIEKISKVGLVLNDVNPADKRYGYYNTGYYGQPYKTKDR
ncbi:MAG: polysaccharide biosynthesis tyrosine autokinase [Marinilabilia sp.]